MQKTVPDFWKEDWGSDFEKIMLRKRNRSFQKDQYKGHLMSDSFSSSSESSSNLGQKQKSSSFFNVPGLFVGFSIKGASDSESARSPTSPLDYRFFTNLGNPFRSPRSYHDGSPKSWNCSKVGLGIVDSLNDEMKSSGKVLGLSKSRNILFGSQLGINIPASPTRLRGSIDFSISTKSLPNNYAVASQTQINSPAYIQLNGSRVAFGTGELQLEPKPTGRIRSCSSDSGRQMSPLTSLTYCDPISNSEDFCLDKNIRAGSPPIIGGDLDFNNFLGVKPSSLPMSFSYGHELKASVSASDIELSEDYTCVISHGPNPKTTHIFGDCIFECHTNELANCTNKKEEQGIKSPQLVNCSGGSLTYPSDDFLSFCNFCLKKLEEGKDIYMYRGEKAFCSGGCRAQGILVEEEKEKALKKSTDDSPKPASCEDIFLAGMVVAT